MGVVVCWDDLQTDDAQMATSQKALRDRCKALAAKVSVK